MIESEKLLERKLREKIEAVGGYCWKLPALHLTGIPDRVLLLPGGLCSFAEIKTTKQKPTKIQLLWHKRLQQLGFEVHIIDQSIQIEQLISNLNIK